MLSELTEEQWAAFEQFAEIAERAGSKSFPEFEEAAHRSHLVSLELEQSMRGAGMSVFTVFEPAFAGLKQIGVGDGTQEFLELRYAGDDKLFVPVERLDLVQKYTGATRPPVDRLGGTSWERAKTRVKTACHFG